MLNLATFKKRNEITGEWEYVQLTGEDVTQLGDQISQTNNSLNEHKDDLTSQDEDKGASLVGFSANEMVSTNVREAILEAFMLGNSRKEDLVDKLLLVDDGLPIDYTSSWQDVLNSVNQLGGMKYLTGVTPTHNIPTGIYSYSFGIDFTINSPSPPKIVVLRGFFSAGNGPLQGQAIFVDSEIDFPSANVVDFMRGNINLARVSDYEFRTSVTLKTNNGVWQSGPRSLSYIALY